MDLYEGLDRRQTRTRNGKTMKTTFCATLLILLLSVGPVMAQNGTIYSSGVPSGTGSTPPPGTPDPGFEQALNQVQRMPQLLGQPATQPCPACPPCAQAAAAAVPATAVQAPPDPCAAYQTRDGYILCRDRLLKLQRIQSYKDSQAKDRAAYEKAKVDAAKAKAGVKKTIEQAIGIPQPLQEATPATTQPTDTTTKKKKLQISQ